jgi:dCTP deaminase
VNVSGFHADPGWDGPLIFAVYNAGPSAVHLHRGLPLFLIWYADLDDESIKRKTSLGSKQIPPATINNLTGGVNSLNVLDRRVREEVERRREEDDKLSTRIHDLQNAQTRNTVLLTILVTVVVGVIGVLFRHYL